MYKGECMNMKTKQRSTFLLLGAFMLLVALLSGCVDVPTSGPTPPALKAEYRFIHAASDLGEVGVSVDGKSVGTFNFRQGIDHQEYTSGTKEVALSDGETLLVSMSTDYRGTFVILGKEAGERTFLKLQERRMFDNPTVADTVGAIRPVHCSPDAPSVDITIAGPGGSFTWSGVAYRRIGAYQRVTPGDYTVTVKPAGGTDAVLTSTVTVGKQRNTVLVVGTVAGGTLSALPIQDN